MPTFQTITVDITPGAKERPVINASQFDNGRPFNVALTWGGVAYTDAGDFDIEIHIKKPDGNIVTATPDNVVNEVCTFVTTEQMCACHGINECEIVLYDNDLHIGTGNFILDVEKAPDEGGIQSASEIVNLASQIDAITLNYLINNTDEIAEIIADKIYPTLEASGDIATFNTILQLPLVSVTADPLATKITRCGVNQWDEEWELGNIDGNTGAKMADNRMIRSKNYIKCVENTVYKAVIDNGNTNQMVIYFYDVNKNFIPYTGAGSYNNGYNSSAGLPTTPAGTCFMLFRLTTEYGTTYNNDISINYPSTDTSYHAYNGTTKPIAEATTIKTLTGVNNVFTDHGPVTVKYKYFPDI